MGFLENIKIPFQTDNSSSSHADLVKELNESELSQLPDWAQRQLNDCQKAIRSLDREIDNNQKKIDDLNRKLVSEKEISERTIREVRQKLTAQLEQQKALTDAKQKELQEISTKLRDEFLTDLKKEQRKIQEHYDNLDRRYRGSLSSKISENTQLLKEIDRLKTKIGANEEERVEMDKLYTQRLREEYALMQQDLEVEKQKIMKEAEDLIADAISASENAEVVVKFYPEASQFATLALNYIGIIDSILSELDLEIAEHYMDSDDANFFYIRRRLKYLMAIGDQNLIRYWDNDLDLLANHGIVLTGSELDRAIDGDRMQVNQALQYYLYNAVVRKTAGPALILVKEMIAMPIYAGVQNVVNLERIQKLERQLIDSISELGYDIVDVSLFKDMDSSSDIICVEQNDVNLDGVTSGQVYEIVKLAVNFGSIVEKTEVKVKL